MNPKTGVLFLSGPMTGIKDWNHPAFNEAARRLRALGYRVWNPAEIDNGKTGKPREYYMRINFQRLVQDGDDAITSLFQLPGWRFSRGAMDEAHVARALGIAWHDYAVVSAS